MRIRTALFAATAATVPLLAAPAAADEGMWTFDGFPAGQVRELLGWAPEYGGRDGFVRGLAETAAWFADPANLAGYKTDRYNT